MKLYSANDVYELWQGNMLDMLDVIKPNFVSSIVTDPPYELNFMGKGWDNSGIAFQKETWEKCYTVLKPGGYLLAFGGTRTFHRIACAIEDAGFEIRDTIMWLYGSGFPKSMNIGLAIDKKEGVQEQRGVGGFNVGGIQEQQNRTAKLYIGSTTDGSKQDAYTDYKSDSAKQWAGWGTALKPAYEPIIVARKPCEGSTTDNVLKYGVGGINIDEGRVPFEDTPNPATNPLYRLQNGYRTTANSDDGDSVVGFGTSKNETSALGRFPSNVILTYDETDEQEVCGGMPDTVSSGGSGEASTQNRFKNVYGEYKSGECASHLGGLGDSGNASRYFYTAKASVKDRDEGLDSLPDMKLAFGNQAQAELKRGNTFDEGGFNKILVRKNIHPTVKPVDLMQYLVRLVTPKGAIILDPFNGSGSTGKAVMYENTERQADYKYIGIELTEQYLPISKARIEHAMTVIPHLDDMPKKVQDAVKKDRARSNSRLF